MNWFTLTTASWHVHYAEQDVDTVNRPLLGEIVLDVQYVGVCNVKSVYIAVHNVVILFAESVD